ncbi:MAG: C4-dicarboxylic acid transporter DauA [Leptospirales bacterium]|nr:C4-dicarboxylic acid transporter DauA [Leptospirales bacterium]
MPRTRYQSPTDRFAIHHLPAAALRAALREGYGRRDFLSDLLAGLVVGAVALPLSMALAIAVGVAPQHGIYTAIVAGFLTAVLGGSRIQVSGPTAAFVVILAPIASKYGLSGLLISGLMAGTILLGLGLARLGRLIEYVPHPVTTGFTSGIALVIATLQVKDLLGLQLQSAPDHYVDRVAALASAIGTFQPSAALIGGFTLFVLLIFPKLTRRIPAPLVALPLAASLAAILPIWFPGFQVDTIASRFITETPSGLLHGIPQLPPEFRLPWQWPSSQGQSLPVSFALLRELAPGAFAIAMLGAIESLLSAVVADGLARTRHDPDSELIAVGIGNLAAPFFGGIPATGAIARTATNIRYGARSPLAAAIHALAMLAAVLALAPLLGYLPMSSLAALLVVVAWNMSEARHFVHTIRVAPRSDAVVLGVCFTLTVLVDMTAGVAVGMVMAAFLFMRRMAEVTQARLGGEDHPMLEGASLPPGVIVYEISGPLFFGAAQKAIGALATSAAKARAVILLMSEVHAMDATGLVALESALQDLKATHTLSLLCGVQEQPKRLLERARLAERFHVEYFDDLSGALQRAANYDRRTSPRAEKV